MFKPLQLYIGLRYTRAKRRNGFISFVSAISIFGIAISLTAIITVLSVMNGFGEELRNRILSMVSHATIISPRAEINDWPQVLELAKQEPRVLAAAPYVEQETMLKGLRIRGGLVRGVVPALERGVSDAAEKMVEGSLDALKPGEFGIVLGRDMAVALGVRVGDPVTVFAPQVRSSPAGVIPQVKRFFVVGTFAVGMGEYDGGLAMIHMEDAQRLFRTGDGVNGVRLKMDDLFQAWEIAASLRDRLPGFLSVRDWSQSHSNLFRAVRMEKTVMFAIFSLIVLVAAFNIVSTLVMLVTDKQADIAILRTLGASPGTILGIFVVLGTFLGIMGTGLGVIGGVALASNVETIVPWLERTFNTQFLSADVYYISDLPSEIRVMDVVKVASLSFVLSVLATLYPAWRASRTDPAEALRYE